jgi:DNA-binding winged helix-turn-helix (wHTH) protein
VAAQHNDRIEELCSKVVSAVNEEELAVAISELRRELRQHIDSLRNIAIPQVPLLFR